MPIGISFYTFQTLSYVIDIYNKRINPTKNILAFFSFVAFFPQLVAGPIERAKNLLPQFFNRKKFDYNLVVGGLRLILWGLFKKTVIADNLGLIVDQIFDPASNYSFLTIIVGAIFFSFQIYCDFSGYSDIAIGVARTLGFKLTDNFKTPYFSKSFTEFWRRWHISLSTWFRDYVYIPLGGSKVKRARRNFNVFSTFLLSGLWHGANFTFLIWGAIHGMALIIEKWLGNYKIYHTRVSPFVIFLIVSLFWLPFRAEDMQHLKSIVLQLIHFEFNFIELKTIFIGQFSLIKSYLFSIVFLSFILLEKKIGLYDFNILVSGLKKSFRLGIYYLLIIIILFMSDFNIKPYFIYFQF
ncbi:MAG: MBOAT family O-acyltransferase [Bacteroidota bacterium]